MKRARERSDSQKSVHGCQFRPAAHISQSCGSRHSVISLALWPIRFLNRSPLQGRLICFRWVGFLRSSDHMIQRRKTRKVVIGDKQHGFVEIGGDAPVSVQTMTAGYTYEIDKCVAEIHKLAAAGADIVRVAVPERKDTEALKEILPQVTVPIVADVHFHFQRALEAIEAGVHKIRLNPGNISERAQVRDVIQACKAKQLPIRIGVNEGSIVERRDKQKRMKELG